MNFPFRSGGAGLVALVLLLGLTACSTTPSPSLSAGDDTKPPVSQSGGTQTKPSDESRPAVENLTLRWEAGMDPYLLLYGIANEPDLHIETRAGDTTLGQADVQVKEGRFLATLKDPGVGVNAEVVLSTLGPDGKEVARLPVPDERMVGRAWSANFAKVVARQLDPKTVLVSGEARVFEGVLAVEIRVGGEVKASQQINLAKGAPAFSEFEERVALDEPLPREGVETYFITQSPKDGSDTIELYTDVVRSTP